MHTVIFADVEEELRKAVTKRMEKEPVILPALFLYSKSCSIQKALLC